MFKKVISESKRGFTLIEILVVIAIIGILVTIAIAAGSSAKSGARDNQRKTDIRLLQVKLEAYRELKGVYPGYLTGPYSDTLVGSGLISDSVLPKDPKTKQDYQYVPLQFSGGTCGISYHLSADLENDTGTTSPVPINSSLSDCNGTFIFTPGVTYDVTSPI